MDLCRRGRRLGDRITQCTDFSVLGRWNHKRMKVEDVRRRMKEARRHLQFCLLLYTGQLDRGKELLHERPVEASSWKDGCIEVLASRPGVSTTVGHMCRYGMTLDDGPGREVPIMKPNRWMRLNNAARMCYRLLRRMDRRKTPV